jgi:hypothetical protein
MKALDLTGKKFARMTGIRRVENAPGYKQARWLFRCDCGVEKVVFGYSVVHGTVQSCGCLRHDTKARLKHGGAGTKEFNSWASMRQRCTNPDDAAYQDYGGRGITICSQWDDFAVFLADMGPRPTGTSLDRRDNEKGYSPENCRWATKQEQVRNRRTTLFYEYDGQKLPLQTWAEHFGVSYQTVWARYKVGKRGHELFGPPVMGGLRIKTSPSQPLAA